jgi:putative Mg2+ transporter-C (MgtC) family protein
MTRVAAAAVLGFALGLEREFHSKSAGLRTNILITIGSALFTVVSLLIASPGDRGRVAAQIVTGVGFLGAGAIMHKEGSVQGLTTAAVIWMNAAVGMAAAIGHIRTAAAVTALTIVILLALRPVEAWLAARGEKA